MKVLKWIKRIFFGFLALIFLALIVGFIYEHMARIIDSKKFKPIGEFVNVGDHKLHYIKKGRGTPTVVFEAGAGPGGHLSWKYVQDEISKITTTISYDRAGILWSERGKDPKSLAAISSDLQNLLVNTNCPKPYILVGHSFAGMGLRKFIIDQKNNISEIIFVDVAQPGQMERFSDELQSLMQPPPLWILKAMSSFGLMRIILSEYNHPNTQENDSINLIAKKLNFKGFDASLELLRNLESIENEASKITSFDSIPLIIITGTSPNRNKEIKDEILRIESIEVWKELQRDLLKLSSNSRQILATESGHFIQTEQPNLLIETIESVINENKSKN